MDKKIYVALDFEDFLTADQFLIIHDLTDVPVKVGMELFYKEGPDVIKRLRSRGHDVFLDLKLHDIPTTVYKAMKNIGKLDVQLTNVHALGASSMIQRAKEGLIEGSIKKPAELIAVTILTSHQEKTIKEELGINQTVDESVMQLATNAKHSGADGVVCSVHEVKALKETLGAGFKTCTPGIRLLGETSNDQKRIASPQVAREFGADYLVVGRSITHDPAPKARYEEIKEAFINGK